jgi:hypothetical protein
MSRNTIVIEGDHAIAMYRLCALKARLRLEVAGMKGRGPSAYSIIKSEFGLTGNKIRVYEQFCEMLKKLQQGEE